ncbi:glycosyl hydrolase family 28-related protein [Streptacidiphilus sp. P02-A3a]|uniref:glycosyl hydrolase family 28-related protein n=1 Tax=Streptacidiphilus sp. P02-A3a TaxID=2704468 RepID=UPI0015FB3D50|nr:glycosyl hydrolase family 28-related protein [Streptacidiphilus sp. P02-A3a]QMU70814.1 hypothetical protein GXP74_23955 [Streptacidiphilus sp. P02-A3a]
MSTSKGLTDPTRRRALLTGAVTGVVAGIAGTVTAATPAAAAAAADPLDWYDVKLAGAAGDGATDDTSAIRAAIAACPPGGTVYFPVGVYLISAQLTLPPRITLRGGYAPHWPQYAKDSPEISACVKAMSGFSDPAMVRVLDKSQGGWTQEYMSSARITDLTLDGGNEGTLVAGIYATGQVVDLALSNVCINNMSGHGLYTDSYGGNQPKGWQMHHVAVQSCGGAGFYHANTGSAGFAVTDMTYEACWAGANGSDGWHIASAISVDLIGCRSEFNAGYGYYAAGSSRIRWVDCDTDRSTMSGWRLECQGGGSRSIILSGCLANRDGANNDITPAGYAGIDIVGTSTAPHNPVTISGCVINVNDNDSGEGIFCPDYGLKTTYAPQVSVSGTLLNGTVAALLDTQNQVVYDSTTRFNATSATTGATTLEAANSMRIIGAAGTNRDAQWWTAASGKRWALRASSTAEAGSNAGSNFDVVRYDDTGTVIDTPVTVDRQTGVTTLNGLAINEGVTGPRMGTATLAAGKATVANTSVSATTRIFLTAQSVSGTAGALTVSARTAGTSFTIGSTSATDASVVAWMLVDPL